MKYLSTPLIFQACAPYWFFFTIIIKRAIGVVFFIDAGMKKYS